MNEILKQIGEYSLWIIIPGIIIILILFLISKKNKNKHVKKNILLINIFILLIISIVTIIFALNNTNYGLDLKGGFEILYEVEPLDENTELTTDMVTSTYKTILRRIDVLGVSEPEITIEGKNRIRIKLAGISDSETARKTISSTASITFRDISDNLLMTSSVLSGVKLSSDSTGKPAVLLKIKDTDKFYQVTNKVKDMTDNRMVIWLDYNNVTDSYNNEKLTCGSLNTSHCLSAASVTEAFASDVIIQGNFTIQEAKSLVELINSGALPTQMKELSSRTIEASFGADSLNKTLTAGAIGILLVMILITAIYRLCGFIASTLMILYTALTFLIFNLIGGVLTLPGISAILLGIGMAVDASIISFERIKDNLKEGKKLDKAYTLGNKMSLSSIIDANVTTFIVALVLFILGESSIKGFATMLMISIITTVIIMVFFSKYIIKLIVDTDFYENKLKRFINYKNKKKSKVYNFIDMKKVILPLTILLVIASSLIIYFNKSVNLGVDFQGGTSITINNTDEETINNIKEYLNNQKYHLNKEETTDKYTNILLKEVLEQESIDKIKKDILTNYEVDSDIYSVSQIVKQELTKNGIISVLVSLVGIIIYVSIRFKFNYAISGIVALMHDVIITMLFFGLFGIEINTLFIAAILTIIGYSINDTIVTFDRIRENYREINKPTIEELKETVNLSVSQTLYRTILTTVSTILPVIALMIFGAHEIINFNIALLVGFIAGVYSSIFLTNILWYLLEKKRLNQKPRKKKWTDDEVEELSVKGINS